MSAGTDRLTVPALTRADAIDVARRRWEAWGLRLARVVVVVQVDGRVMDGELMPQWRVEAEVEIDRRDRT